MSLKELGFAASTIWVILAAILVIFMQAGFAFLEAGLTRMKNAGHIAGKNVLIFGICSIVYWAVGFGIAFGDGGLLVGTHGFFPSVTSMISVGKAPFEWFSEIPGAAGYMFEVVFAGVSLAIVWGAMAERAKLWVYFAFGVIFTLIYSVASHWIWSPHGWLFAKGMQDFAGSTVVHYQGALAGLAGALILGPRIGKFNKDGSSNPILGHNQILAILGTFILAFGWFGFNPGSTFGASGNGALRIGIVAVVTMLAAGFGAVSAMLYTWWTEGKPNPGMMANGMLAGMVAITAPSGFVGPQAAMVIGLVAGVLVCVGVVFVERVLKVDDPVGAVAVHGINGLWGVIATGIFADGTANYGGFQVTGALYGNFGQLAAQIVGAAVAFAWAFGASYIFFKVLDRFVKLRVSPEDEIAGLDLPEMGLAGYIPDDLPLPAPALRPATAVALGLEGV